MRSTYVLLDEIVLLCVILWQATLNALCLRRHSQWQRFCSNPMHSGQYNIGHECSRSRCTFVRFQKHVNVERWGHTSWKHKIHSWCIAKKLQPNFCIQLSGKTSYDMTAFETGNCLRKNNADGNSNKKQKYIKTDADHLHIANVLLSLYTGTLPYDWNV